MFGASFLSAENEVGTVNHNSSSATFGLSTQLCFGKNRRLDANEKNYEKPSNSCSNFLIDVIN